MISRTECNASRLLNNKTAALKRFFHESSNVQIPTCQKFPTKTIPKMCDPILAFLLKMQPHYSQSTSENATPTRGTSQSSNRAVSSELHKIHGFRRQRIPFNMAHTSGLAHGLSDIRECLH